MKSVFLTNAREQKKTIEMLMAESRADTDFYMFLAGSSMVATLGLVLNNPVVIIGGMLVAPLLFPILSLGMGVVTSSSEAIARAVKIIGKSVSVVLVVSFLIAFLFGNDKLISSTVITSSTANLEYFFVAFISGIVGAFAWVKQDTNTLPGVAVSVSLLPPLSALAIGISIMNKSIISGAMTLFIINLIGITLASIGIFSLFGFSQMQKEQKKMVKKEEKELNNH